MKSSVEWLYAGLISNPITKEHFDHNEKCLEAAKVMEKEQRRKDFVNGYKERAKLSGKVFDEISEAVANKLFKQQQER